MYQLPKFLVLRFPPGGGGNFLASILQCSTNVGHWNADIEQQKPHVNWEQYFEKSFNPNLADWLQTEPIATNQLGTRNIFSAWYDRGNELTIDEFLSKENRHGTNLYHSLKRQNKWIPVFWHKDVFPSFFKRSYFINILLDQSSVHWFDRSWYYKHYSVKFVGDHYSVIRKRHRSSIQPQNSDHSNVYQVQYKTFTGFARQEIYNNPWRNRYLKADYLKNCNGSQPEYTLFLSDLLNFDKFFNHYQKLCKWLKITELSKSQAYNLFAIWRNRHVY